MADRRGREGELIINRGGKRKRDGGSESAFSGESIRSADTAKTDGMLKMGPTKPNRAPTDLHELPPAAYYPWHALSPRKTETLETGDIYIEPAAEPGKPAKFDWISIVFQPLGALLVIVAFLAVLYFSGTGMSMGLYMLIGAVSGILGILWGILRYRGQKKDAKRIKDENERKYRDYLKKKKEELVDATSAQKRVMEAEAPSVSACARMNEKTALLWSRLVEEEAFLLLRLGTGESNFARKIIAPEKRYAEENALNDDARDLAEKFRMIEETPICCNLRSAATLGIIGERSAAVSLSTALIIGAAALHSYEDLKIVILYPAAEHDRWAQARFLPHVWSDDRKCRYLAENKEQANALLKIIGDVVEYRKAAQDESVFSRSTEFSPHYLVIVADMSYLKGTPLAKTLCANGSALGISCIFLGANVNQLPQQCRMIAELRDEDAILYDKDQVNTAKHFRPETVTPEVWKRFVSTLAPIRLETPTISKGIPGTISFFEAWGITKPEEIILKENWAKNHPENSMSTLIGAGRGGEAVEFDIHPNKSGAHGLFVGGTSSGKTTMVRSWVLSMAVTFSPERVTFVLVDFKEPGLLTGLDKLPHVVGTVGKLDVDIDRNLTALKSEISRRQVVFDRAGSINIYDYLEKHYSNDASAEEPMPFLYIVVDELNEFKMWSRDGAGNNWMALLDQLYQTGSALGIHIVAGSQTPGPFSQVMLSNASFRWCLKTKEQGDSKSFLGSEDAYRITSRGRAFIRVGGAVEEVQPLFADGIYYTPQELADMPEREMALVSLNGARDRVVRKKGNKPSELEVLAERIARYASYEGVRSPSKIWPERLPEKVLLQDLPAPEENMLSAVAGLVDDPTIQKQYPLTIDLQQTGSFLVYGLGQTGKTTFLQTFLFSMLQNNSPDILDVYLVESDVGDFDGFEAFPHIRKLEGSDSAEKTVRTVKNELDNRRKTRKDKNAKRIMLLVDNLNGIISNNRDEIKDIVQYGASQGVYLVASATNAGGASSVSSVENLMRFGLSFWISENVYDYRALIHSHEIRTVPPANIHGRGIAGLERVVSYQTALIFDHDRKEDAAERIRDTAKNLWGERTRENDSILPKEADEDVVILGRDADTDEFVKQNFKTSPCLLVIGDNREKRASCLRTAAQQIINRSALKTIIGVDLEREKWAGIEGVSFMRSGQEFDRFLSDMRDSLVSNQGKDLAPFLFIFDNLAGCIENSSKDSVNRIDKNLLLNAGTFSVSVVAGCSYLEAEKMLQEEERTIASADGAGKEVIPLTRMAFGRCVLLDAEPKKLPSVFQSRYSFGENGCYYLGAGGTRLFAPLDDR